MLWLPLERSNLKKKALRFVETSRYVPLTTRCNVVEELNVQHRHCELHVSGYVPSHERQYACHNRCHLTNLSICTYCMNSLGFVCLKRWICGDLDFNFIFHVYLLWELKHESKNFVSEKCKSRYGLIVAWLRTLLNFFLFCCISSYILANNQLDALFHVFIYFIPLHVSSIKCSSSGDLIVLTHSLPAI